MNSGDHQDRSCRLYGLQYYTPEIEAAVRQEAISANRAQRPAGHGDGDPGLSLQVEVLPYSRSCPLFLAHASTSIPSQKPGTLLPADASERMSELSKRPGFDTPAWS